MTCNFLSIFYVVTYFMSSMHFYRYLRNRYFGRQESIVILRKNIAGNVYWSSNMPCCRGERTNCVRQWCIFESKVYCCPLLVLVSFSRRCFVCFVFVSWNSNRIYVFVEFVCAGRPRRPPASWLAKIMLVFHWLDSSKMSYVRLSEKRPLTVILWRLTTGQCYFEGS